MACFPSHLFQNIKQLHARTLETLEKLYYNTVLKYNYSKYVTFALKLQE